MQLVEKLKVLSDSAKYDVSCSSSGSDRKRKQGGVGNAALGGICHSWSSDGRCISLLKVLFSNYCIYDCKYCVNRISNDVKRASFTPEELADLTINFYRRNYIEGLFLSSGIMKNPDYTMELMIRAVKKLREEYNFCGYIHMKAIPGASAENIRLAGLYSDRLSVNIELPSESGLKLLAPQKEPDKILRPMNQIKEAIVEAKELKPIIKSTPMFVPAGQTTQLIVGATADSDYKILRLSQKLYDQISLKRVYYSAYVPINSHPDLPAVYSTPPMLREHRLYQADWLLRFYGFRANELLNENNENFDLLLDPKCDWALNNLDKFPVEINTADYPMLLRIPGIGVQSAKRLYQARKLGKVTFEDLKKFRVVLKRAKYFITCMGKYYGETNFESNDIRNKIVACEDESPYEQISLFSGSYNGYLEI